ncbi:MAG TPA: PP2C family protein-serine/threonine phosphatase [Rubrobacteraceae bacterium]|nr:PP2C family protein-serine/threonine phosphatase [Rubrobacteraceae bacterium]
MLSPLLGLVFLGYPIRVVLESDPTPTRVLLTLGGAALFAGVFLWLMWMHDPLPSAAPEPSEVRKRRAAIAFLAGLVVALNLTLGNEWRVLFFHVNIAAGFMLLRKDAYAAIAGLAVVTFVLGITSGLAFFALPTAAIGLWATAFVRQVTAVAETSERLRRAEEDREREAQELSAARVIQQQLLPKELPSLPGWRLASYYQPARAVGGDFYDFLELPDGQLALVAGDVTDKGIPAALVMTTTHSIFRGDAPGLVSPGAVLEQANNRLYPDIPAHMFVTCLYAVLDPRSGRLRYANAGHNLPYVATADRVTELRARGMPLGAMPDMTYEENEAYLAPGESILLHSDGLVEAHNPAGEMFGFPRLQEIVESSSGSEHLIDECLIELREFVGSDWEQEDDITLVTLKRTTSEGS